MNMNEIELGNCMRALPRVKTSPAFTSDVLRAARNDTRTPVTPRVWRLAAAFAMAVCLIAVVQLAMLQEQRKQRMETLRLEQQRIQAELAAVKKTVNEAEPMVVLENDKGARVIMDLDSAVQPVSLRTYD